MFMLYSYSRLLTLWSVGLYVSVNKCCVGLLNTGKVLCSTHFNIDGTVLSVVESVRDLGIMVSRDLSPSLHISE